METKGTLIVYPDVRWVTPKSFADLEQVGLVYKFHDFEFIDSTDYMQSVLDQVSAKSNTYNYWTFHFIPNAG